MNKNSGFDRYKRSCDQAGTSKGKHSEDISNGKTKLKQYFDIDCHKLKVFTLKENFDFSQWDEEKFHELVQSIEKVGVLQPIIIRETEDEKHPYEILAGEHRWKASVQLGKETIPARIIEDCDDDKARSIFTLTNILARDITIIDKIKGWGYYYAMTKGESETNIEGLKNDGLIDPNLDSKEYSKKQIYRYYKISTLEQDFLDFIPLGVLSINSAVILSNMPDESKAFILQYKKAISKRYQFNRILDLYQNKIEDYSFDTEGMQYVLSEKNIKKTSEIPNSFTTAAVVAKKSLKKVLKSTDYHRVDKVTESGIGLYYQLEQHPELLRKVYNFKTEENLDENDITERSDEAIEKMLESSIIIEALNEYFENHFPE